MSGTRKWSRDEGLQRGYATECIVESQQVEGSTGTHLRHSPGCQYHLQWHTPKGKLGESNVGLLLLDVHIESPTTFICSQ